jgi:Ca2+-binding EF-hand superfamily protein
MVRIIFIFFLFTFSICFNSHSNELTSQEKLIFNFIDLDKDKSISTEEINKLIILLFQLIDEDKDGSISELEIIELKNIIESLS